MPMFFTMGSGGEPRLFICEYGDGYFQAQGMSGLGWTASCLDSVASATQGRGTLPHSAMPVLPG